MSNELEQALGQVTVKLYDVEATLKMAAQERERILEQVKILVAKIKQPTETTNEEDN